jgi:hypothetical protein
MTDLERAAKLLNQSKPIAKSEKPTPKYDPVEQEKRTQEQLTKTVEALLRLEKEKRAEERARTD